MHGFLMVQDKIAKARARSMVLEVFTFVRVVLEIFENHNVNSSNCKMLNNAETDHAHDAPGLSFSSLACPLV